MLSVSEKKNAIWNSSSFVIVSVVNFLIFSLCIKYYETSIFGLYIFFQSILNIGVSLDFGFGITTIKHISEYSKKNDYEQINRFFSTFLLSYIFLSSLIGFLFYLYYLLFLSNSEMTQNSNVYGANLIFLFLDLTFVFTYISMFLRSMLEGFSEFILVSKINVTIVFINLGLLILVLYFEMEILFLSILSFVIALFSTIFLLAALLRSKKFIKLKIEYFSIDVLRKLFSYSITINMSFFIGSFSDAIIKYLLGTMISLNFVAYFESGKKIINFTNGLIVAAQKELFVKLSSENTIGRLSEFVNTKLYEYSKVSNYYSIVLYGIFNPILCFMIYYWFGYFETVIIFLVFLTAYALINFAVSIYYVLIVEGRGIYLILIQTTNIVLIYVFLYLSLTLFNGYFGLFGFTLATIINVTLIFWSLKKTTGLNYIDYLNRIKFNDITKLIFSISLQVIMLIFYGEYMNYILILFTVINILLFSKYLKFIMEKLNIKKILNKS